VVITRNFGSQLMLDEFVEIDSGTSAMDALRQIAEIETAYGGGFVNAINGVRSGYTQNHASKEDWFISINGIMANTGALDYMLYPGDTEHWDFRNWSFHQFVPATVGNFPEPFLHGYGGKVYPTIVVYQEGWEGDAMRIADTLIQLGVKDVATSSYTELIDEKKGTANLILLGSTDFAPVDEMNEVWKRLGFFIKAESNKLTIYDEHGNMSEYGTGAGFIQATQSLWNPKGIGVCENVVWMVSGSDERGVKQAVDALINQYEDFAWACAMVTVNGVLYRVPQ
jgi:hypothetical protein